MHVYMCICVEREPIYGESERATCVAYTYILYIYIEREKDRAYTCIYVNFNGYRLMPPTLGFCEHRSILEWGW